MGDDEHEGASIEEQLIEACRRDNTDLLTDLLDGKSDGEIAKLLNGTTTVMGNHLYHEAASRGNYDIIDLLLDQPNFECDPITRIEGDTPLHSAIRWLNSEPQAQRPFGHALIEMMLEAGSNPRVKNKGGLTALQLVDPRNTELKDLIQRHQYASQNAGDFINVSSSAAAPNSSSSSHPSALPPPPPIPSSAAPPINYIAPPHQQLSDDSDEDAEFSGSDDEERAEWERRRRQKHSKR